MTEQEPRHITLTYAIGEGEEQHLDFFQLDPPDGEWICTLEPEEVDRIIKSAIDRGTLE